MSSKKYEEASLNLIKAADIAIESIKKFPPKKESTDFCKHLLNCYHENKMLIINSEPKFRNLTSLKYDYEAIFTRFQESNGEDVEEFWRRIKEEGLPYKRENKVAKILKRRKINNDLEYNFVTDVIVPYQQEGLINEEESFLLKKYLGDFEMKFKK
ncbi:hypothetical protein [Flavobacterium aciduliphilum]|uniref:Uncharacterized protein n=1 Tax=Flavobacterium aciduliphilum TaxID=1101402 RepID=A0A328YCT3_9FLAO|nr:hypothetical protein [Flavobacterium aciduliphilum]RAR71749.1 hypothetical protein CLV55_106100 [Flavobacterium aciduliphilum]